MTPTPSPVPATKPVVTVLKVDGRTVRCRVADRIVDVFEPVQVEEKQHDVVVLSHRLRRRLVEMVRQQPPGFCHLRTRTCWLPA